MVSNSMICVQCEEEADYICQSGRCIPCEKRIIGKEGLEMLAIIVDMTKEGKKPINPDDALKEYVIRDKIKKARFPK